MLDRPFDDVRVQTANVAVSAYTVSATIMDDLILAELHGDLFSRHASPLEVYVFVAVDERGEHVLSDEICRRCNGKQQVKAGRPKCAAPRLVYDIFS